MHRHLRIPAIAILLLGFAAAAVAFEPGEQVWCNQCKGYVDAPHSDAHGTIPGFGYCDRCEGFFPGVEIGEHTHLGEQRPVEQWRPDPRPNGNDGSAGPSTNTPSPPESPGGNKNPDKDPLLELLGKLPKWAWVVPAGLFSLFLLVALFGHARANKKSKSNKKRKCEFVDGVPQGIMLRKDVLVCESKESFGGGTSQVYEARFNNGDKWEPAFVKRIIGAGMRSDQRFPMIEFESNVLKRLGETGAVPRVLVDPDNVSLSDGSHWSYYAMSAAQGEPWPEHGGLGRDTHVALAALCEALMRLHDSGIGHHDLKPQNIFWDSRRKRITLLDFGSAIDHTGEFVNPIGGTMPGTKPWIPPASDGKILAELTALSDNWVYGLLFCEAILGCIKNDEDRTQRHTPEKPEDRDWLRENLARETSPAIAEAVVDGLFAFDKTRRMKLQEFLELIRKEWGV